MTKVFVPVDYNDDLKIFIMTVLLESFYQSEVNTGLINIEGKNKYCLVVIPSASMGKAPLMRAMQKLGFQYAMFTKNGKLFKKWLDTGIVDLIGEYND